MAVDAVEHYHVERRGRRALLAKAAHMEALGVRAAMDDLVDGALVAMEGEYDRLVGREQRHEVGLAHAVWVILWREERHQVHDIHHAELQLRGMLAQPIPRRQRLQPRHIAGAR